jgi:hypothetical protein
MPHIRDVPLERWPSGWLKLQTASLLNQPGYILMTNKEKRDCGLPVSEEEMRKYIEENWR